MSRGQRDATRADGDLVLGASPRASIGLLLAAKALAAVRARSYVIPDDIKALYPSVLYHRVVLGAEGRLGGRTAQKVIDEAVALLPAPVDVGPRAAQEA